MPTPIRSPTPYIITNKAAWRVKESVPTANETTSKAHRKILMRCLRLLFLSVAVGGMLYGFGLKTELDGFFMLLSVKC